MRALWDQACSQLNDTEDDTDTATKTLHYSSHPSNAATPSKEKGKKEIHGFRSQNPQKFLTLSTHFFFLCFFF